MLAHSIEFSPQNDREALAAAPAAPAVFLLRGEEEGEPYVSKSANLRRRLQRLLAPAEERSRRLNLRERVRRIEYTLSGSDFESRFLLYRTLQQVFPETYRTRLRLRLAPLVRLNLDNPYPRAWVTRRLGRRGTSLYYGPFPTRAAAEKFLSDSLDLYKMRRCDFDLAPDPAFPGCIYSEMKMCLAPCFKGCSDAEYAEEVGRVRQYLDSGGRSLVAQLEGERERASAGLEFEHAAGIHARLEKALGAMGLLPDLARRVDRLAGVVVQRSTEPESVALFRVHAGCIALPVVFPVQPREGKPVSMEARLGEALATTAAPAKVSAAERMEHLALLKHWYYRSSRAGEIFLADEKGALPMRRMVRGIARVFKGEPVQEFIAESAERAEKTPRS
ncbi:MAG: hypothetical protein ACRD2R_09450 [Terriglobales bacterium]